MAKIYDAQIQWQSPSAHRFQAAPLEDYISEGLNAVSKAAGIASEGIQKLHDQDAAAIMAKAGEEAKNYINNYEDFFGDYVGKMEEVGMQYWDDAFAQLDEPTKRRFEMNNPKAREIFEFTVKKAVTEKTFNHEYTEYDRRVPVMASKVIALKDPEKIKAAMADLVYNLTENTGMRMQDAEKVIDKVQKEIAEGTIDMLIGEDRLDEAHELNNDLVFTAMMGPDTRVKNNNAIRNILQKRQDELLKKKESSNPREENKKYVLNSLVEELSYAHDNAVSNGKGAEWADLLYDVANDFKEGQLKDTYVSPDGTTVLLSDLIPEYALYTDMIYADRAAVAEDLVDAFKASPDVLRKRGRIKVGVGSLLDSLPKDDNGRYSIKDIDAATAGRISSALAIADEDYSVLNQDLRDLVEELRAVDIAYTEMARAALQPSNLVFDSDVIEKNTWIGSTEEYASLQGNFNYGTLQEFRGDKEKNEVFSPSYITDQGTRKNQYLRDAFLRRADTLAEYTNKGKRARPGSAHEMVIFDTVALNDLSVEEKRALGIENATPRQVADAMKKEVSLYDTLGILDSSVEEKNTLRAPTLPEWVDELEWKDLTPAERKAVLPDAVNRIAVTASKDNSLPWLLREWPSNNTDVNTLYEAIINNDASILDNIKNKRLREELKKNYKKFQETTVKDINTFLKESARYKGMSNANDVVQKALETRFNPQDRPTYTAPDMSRPIEETDYYLSLVRMIKNINSAANPDAATVRDIASKIRAASYETWANGIIRGSTSKPVAGSHARQVVDQASSLTIKSKGI